LRENQNVSTANEVGSQAYVVQVMHNFDIIVM